MSKADTWMPLHIGAYLADTMHLRAAEHGAYLLLLMHYWRNGPLPDDDAKLSGIARMSRKEWVEIAPTIREFFTADAGKLHQRRADAERAKAQQISSKRADAAREKHMQAARKRGALAEQADCKPSANAPANAEQEHTHARVAIPQQEQKKDSELRSGAGAPPAEASLPLNTPGIPDATKALFEEGAEIVCRLTGEDRKGASKQIGVLRRRCQDDARILAALRDAEAKRVEAPIAWVTKVLSGRREAPAGPDWDTLADATTTYEGETYPAVEGWALPIAGRLVAEAAGVSGVEAFRDWTPLRDWLRAGLDLHDHILSAIRRIASRSGYAPPASLAYFDRAVREAGMRRAA
ncbi:conserved protein of unknown function (plasmid) [Rhodovastum atsumiense]|uniref:DUF1376 domain-containing protein n=1 Tax=Rhodovastum atsumiense TaxID=504468 RepID=A0A5M6IN33_9PROT|nr:DUF1376 domain-containing protein [Rhodovastum atsumiense]KAA5609671.1 DUF1376 domain-containing protein [Rhodovastum atsumiense]CAH2606434.1 conserved protein of unknown function [Rhodovastum atsumiense]